MLMTTQMSVAHILHALIMKSNGQSNGNKWVVYFRAPINDTLAIAHKCWDPFRQETTIKKWQNLGTVS